MASNITASVSHNVTISGTNNSSYSVSKNAWNDAHVVAVTVNSLDGADLQTGTVTATKTTGLVPTTRTVNGHALSSDITITKGDLGIGNVENTALSTWTGSTAITTLGTIATGTWNGTAITDGKIASALTGKTYNGLTPTSQTTGFTIAGGTASRTLTLDANFTASAAMLKANNLSDVSDAAASRANLSLGSANSPTFANLTLSGQSNAILAANATGVIGPVTVNGNGGSYNSTTRTLTLTGGGGSLEETGSTFILANGSKAFTGNQSMGDKRLTNLADAVEDGDAANLAQVRAEIAAGGVAVSLTANRAVISAANGSLTASNTTATEVSYLNGVTSAIQTQLDGKQAAGSYLTVGNNLSDVANATTARTNLGLGTAATQNISAFDAAGTAAAAAAAANTTAATNLATHAANNNAHNISVFGAEVVAAATAAALRAILQLGSAATSNTTAFDAAGAASAVQVQAAADLAAHNSSANAHGLTTFGATVIAAASAAALRTILQLGNLSLQNGTFSGTFSGSSSGTNTGDQDLSGLMTKAANLSDVANTTAARTNLGLGSAATSNTSAFDAAGAATAAVSNHNASQNVHGLGTLAFQNGTFSGNHSGNSSGTNTGDQDLSGLMTKTANFGDVANTTTARTNLGLGNLALQNGTFSGTHSGNSSGTNTGDQDLSGLMVKANNLSDLANTTTARTNLGLGNLSTQNGVFSGIHSGNSSGNNTGDQDLSGYMLKSNNLSDAANITLARTNLGLGSLATQNGTFSGGGTFASGGFTLTLAANTSASGTNTGDQDLSGLMTKAANLSDVANATTARTNLGLGSLATQNGTFSGTHSGNSSGTNTGDQDLSGLMVKANNLSDVANATTARINLCLGNLALQNGTFSGTHSGNSSGNNTGDQDLSGYMLKSDNLSGLGNTTTARTNLGLGSLATQNSTTAAFPGLCQGRLTLTSGTPVTTTDITAAGTIYFTPYKGNQVSLYNGSQWVAYTFTERSLALSGLTSGKNYDIFLYDNSGTLTLELSAAWTNDTTRADALTTQDGVYVKSGATTRLWLGTLRTTGTTTTEKTARRPFLWNYYNPVPYAVRCFDTTDTWTYTSGWRLKRNDGNNAIEIVLGLAGPAIYLGAKQGQVNTSASVNRAVAIGYDATNTPATGCQFMVTQLTVATELTAHLAHHPGLGYHYYAELEYSVATGTTTWYGDGGDTAASKMQTGMSGLWSC